MISICLPTKGRPKIFKKMCVTALDHAYDPGKIEIVSYHEEEDTTTPEYEYLGNHKEIIGGLTSLSDKFNACYREAVGDIFLLISDDFEFESKGWDKAVEEAFETYPDKIVLVWPNDHNYRSRFASSPFLHRNWVDTVGYLTVPYFSTQFLDNWWFDVARIIKRGCFLRQVVIKHCWVIDDATHIEYMNRTRKDKLRALYSSEEMKIKRMEDAKKLQEFIDNFKG